MQLSRVQHVMTSTEARGSSATREFALALASGGLYGATNTVVGHPFDTVKTKMQTQSGFTNSGALASARQILSSEGAVGFYRGCLPPMWGSAVYRSAQFAVYDLLYAEAERYPAALEHVPGTDMQWRVLGAGAVGATARTVLESPIEYAKVKGQTNQKWKLGEVYRGAGLQWARTGPMMTLYFCPWLRLLDGVEVEKDILAHWLIFTQVSSTPASATATRRRRLANSSRLAAARWSGFGLCGRSRTSRTRPKRGRTGSRTRAPLDCWGCIVGSCQVR